MIIKNVPYISDKNEKYASCQGPPTVMMAIKYFLPDLKLTFDALYDKMDYSKGEWFFEMYIVTILHELGIPSVYNSTNRLTVCSDSTCFRKISGLDFSAAHQKEFNLQHYNSSIKFVIKNKLFQQRNLDIEFIKDQINNSKLVIATVNRNNLTSEKGYKGHFILIKGYNRDSFICNDAYFEENFSISYEKFLEAFYYVNWNKPNDKNEKDIVVVG